MMLEPGDLLTKKYMSLTTLQNISPFSAEHTTSEAIKPENNYLPLNFASSVTVRSLYVIESVHDLEMLRSHKKGQ